MIQSQVGKCLDDNATYLNVSKSGIVALGKLNGAECIQILNLSLNCLQDVMNIGMYTNLWKLDLSYNKVKSLTGLVNFIVLGALNLSYNQLTWPELLKLRHIHILDLTLHGNPHLVKDTYYQIHVIDCLPNCWMLDGKMITSEDHFQVHHFFKRSEKQKQPVRHKLPKNNFFPSFLKKVEVCGTFGTRAAHVLTTFPLNIPASIEIDKKRLQYLAFNMQEIIALENIKCEIIKNHTRFLEQLLKLRSKNREQSNVLFLLLLASLEFSIPSQTIVEMLSVTNLHKCGDIFSIDLFLMPRELRSIAVGLLFNAIKLDREENVDAGVYEQLFLHLSSNVPELLKFTSSKTCKNYELPKTQCYKDYRFLLAAEICQVLMLVPSFYYYLQLQNTGLFCVIIEATNQKDIHEIINRILKSQVKEKLKNREEVSGEDQEENSTFGTVAGTWQRELSETLTAMIHNHLKKVTSKEPVLTACEEILYLKPFKNNNFKKRCASRQTLNKVPERDFSIHFAENKHIPRIGETVILGKQVFGKIIALPSQYTAKVYIDGVLEPNGSVIKRVKESWKHYKTINLQNMDWDACGKCWRWKMPKDSYMETVFMEPLSTVQVKASQSHKHKEMWSTPVMSVSANSTRCRSLSYVTHPDSKEKSFYLNCTDLDQEEQIADSYYLRGSQLNFDKPEVKVIMNMDNVPDSIAQGDMNSDFENYVMGLKPASTKRGHPDSELLVLHLEQSKRPHSAIPIMQVSKIDLGKEAQQDYFKKKYPLLSTEKNTFPKFITKPPVSSQASSRSISATDVASESYLYGGDSPCRDDTTETTATESVDTSHSLPGRAGTKKQEYIKRERPKSHGSYPELKNYIQVSCGKNWLANGRNLFEESRYKHLNRFSDLPGWKQRENLPKKPLKSFEVKAQCPVTAFRITRPKSSCSISKMDEESFSRALANEAVRIQQYISFLPSFLPKVKKNTSKQRSTSAQNFLKKEKEDEDSQDEEDEKDNGKLEYNLGVLAPENERLEFSSSPSSLKHPPNTPVSSLSNWLQK